MSFQLTRGLLATRADFRKSDGPTTGSSSKVLFTTGRRFAAGCFFDAVLLGTFSLRLRLGETGRLLVFLGTVI